MVNFTNEQIFNLIKNQNIIRNVCLVGQIKHGKSSLNKSLFKTNGINIENRTDCDRLNYIVDEEINKDSYEMTFRFKINSLFFEDNENRNENNNYFINLIDTPGNCELSSEVSTAIRISDGALFVVDGNEGLSFSSEMLMKNVFLERIKPILFINKLDQLLLNSKDFEEIYQSLFNTIYIFNINLSATMGINNDNEKYYECNILNNTVLFGSVLEGWSFTINDFARMYSNKFGIPIESLKKKLWGNNYFDPSSKKWVTNSIKDNSILPRGFCQFILKPINEIILTILDNNHEKLLCIIQSLNIGIDKDKLSSLNGKNLLKYIMSRFLPLEKSILSSIAQNIPSPINSQRNRIGYLYEGSMDDHYSESIRNCNSNGPLLANLIKFNKFNNSDQIYAICRIFSGKIKKGDKVNINGHKKSIEKIGIIINSNKDNEGNQEIVFLDGETECLCGNIVGILGLENVDKFSTIRSYIPLNQIEKEKKEALYDFCKIKFSVFPIVGKTIEPKESKDLVTLLNSLTKFIKTDAILKLGEEEYTGNRVLYGSGILHLENCLKELKSYVNFELNISNETIIPYRESVTEESKIRCVSKSPNKQNRFLMKSQPLPTELINEIEIDQTFDPLKNSTIENSNYLCDVYGWTRIDCKNIWSFGMEENKSNVLVNYSDHQNLYEIKEDIIRSFKYVTGCGVLCEEKVRGVRFNLLDVYYNSLNSIVRGSGSFALSTARRVMYASQLSASPTLLEPMYNSQINAPHSSFNDIVDLLKSKRGLIINSETRNHDTTIYAQLPVKESFNFNKELDLLTFNKSTIQNIFSHWSPIGIYEENNNNNNNNVTEIAMSIRRRKGLKLEIPLLSEYNDKI